jgi:hypothetical protein
MWPKKLPDYILQDVRRSAEVGVFQRINDVLSDEWTCFYSSPWWGIDRRGGEREGEADFILSHPEKGVLFLEVKGGQISYDPERKTWYSTDRNAIRHTIKDPIQQATSCKHRFIERMKNSEDWPKKRVRMRHGVVFPNSMRPKETVQSLGGYNKSLFAFSQEFEASFDEWIETRLSNHGVDDYEIGPGLNGISLLRRIIADPITLLAPPKQAIDLEIEQMEMILTGAQLQVIEELIDLKKAVVEGGAGTGKTVLATELASRLSFINKKVLFVCRGEALSKRIKLNVRHISNIDVDTVGSLMNRFAGPTSQARTYQKYEVLIVDEAQDIDQDSWENFNKYLTEDASIFAFFDSNQAVYKLPDDISTRLGAKSQILKLNLRNTQWISKVTNGLYEGPLIRSCGPEGVAPQNLNLQLSENQFQLASDMVKNLVRNELVSENYITCLVENEQEVSIMMKHLLVDGMQSRRADEVSISAITVETVSRFKGLESPIVIILASNSMSRNMELAYVAVSRARSRLIILGSGETSILQKAINDAINQHT